MRSVIAPASIRSIRGTDLNWRRLSTRDRAIVATAALAVLAAAAALSYGVYRQFGAPSNQYDLRIYYNAVTYWRSGNSLYDYAQFDPVNGLLGFTYPPVAAMAMYPMTALGWRWVVVLSNLGVLLATAGLVLLALRERLRLRGLGLAMATGAGCAVAFCLQPISQTAAYGQVNTFLALLVAFDVLVLVPRKSRWAGMCIGLATAIKLTPAIFLVYLVLDRRWRALRVSLSTAATTTIIAAIWAPAITWQYFTSLLWDPSRVGLPDNTANQSINGTLARLSAGAPPDKVLWAVCSLLALLVGSRRIWQALNAGDILVAMTICGFLGVLISPVSWLHHAVWVLPAMVALLWQVISTFPAPARASFSRHPTPAKWGPQDRRAMRTWAGTAALTMTGLLIFVPNTRDMFGLPDAHYTGLGIGSVLAGSIQAIWMLAAVVFLPIGAARRSPEPAVGPVARVNSDRNRPRQAPRQ